ncbi:MAG: hypothetical protein WKF56_00400 [Candidatus Limnocylindrales bacterium]
MSALPRPHSFTRLPSLLVLSLALGLGACSSGGVGASRAPVGITGATPAPSSTASASGAASPIEGLEHATGATDVILRYEEGGGFIMPAFLAAAVPHFTLYGDGTVIFRNPALEAPLPSGSVLVMNPLRTAKLSEDQIQEVLRYALGDGGLATARPRYDNDMIADASTATFFVDAAGIKKSVSVYALGLEAPGVADAPARAAFARLAQRLTDFDRGGSLATLVYRPAAYRGVLFESPGVAAPDIRDWPWPDVTPADFVADSDADGVQFPHRTMTTAELDALGISGYEGGYQNMILRAKGKTYTFALRPLLLEEVD